MKQYLTEKSLPSSFAKKTDEQKELINSALSILDVFGMPLDRYTARGLEKMAMVFLAVANVTKLNQWKNAKDMKDGISFKTRDIIEIINKHFNEKISSGSYDDIRRKDLKLLVLGEIVLQTSPNSARNSPNRGYALSPAYSKVVRKFGAKDWEKEATQNFKSITTVKQKLSSERSMSIIPVQFTSGKKIEFSPGKHNELQKVIIEKFLPRYGFGAEVLYVGDSTDKLLHLEEKKLKELKFFELNHGELPDIVAYSKKRNWLYLIEAVYSSGPISDVRMAELKRLTKDCTAEIIYITAFLENDTFRKFCKDIAWETEVWIAEHPDHLIHFNGDKFLGPYK